MSSLGSDDGVNALNKKQRKRQLMKEVWAMRKSQKKQRKNPKAPISKSPKLGPSRGQVRREKLKEEFSKRIQSSSTVLIDLDFEEYLSEKEKNSLAQQIMYCYGMNKKAENPVQIYLSSVRGTTESYLRKIPGFPDKWIGVKTDKQPYLTTFKNRRESLVYLTADSPNIIETLESDKIYIIGGIVDRNRLKNITKDKAVQHNISTARFPLNKYCKMGVGSNVLTINHCFDILLARLASEDWPSAFCRIIPTRKDLMLREEYNIKYGSILSKFTNAAEPRCPPRNRDDLALQEKHSRPTAVVVGASRGIGYGFATVLRKRGYDILMVGRSAANLETASKKIKCEVDCDGNIFTFAADCSVKRDCYLLRDFVKSAFGRGRGKLSCLVNSAGTFKWDEDIPQGNEPIEYMMESNYKTKQYVLEMMVPFLLKKNYSGLQDCEGKPFSAVPRVVLVAPQVVVGKDSKNAQLGYNKAMATLREWSARMKSSLGKKGIHIQLLEPPLIDTEMSRKEFNHCGMDWSTIQKPAQFASDVINQSYCVRNTVTT